MVDAIRHLVHWYRGLGWPFALGLGVGFVLLSMAMGLLAVLGLPADYFVRGGPRRGFWQSHALLRFVFVIAKNLFGGVAFLAGFVMALPLVPGPGALFMLVGLAAIDFPGKRRLERRMLAEPRVLASVNKLRARFGRPPMQTEETNRCS